MVTIRKPDHVDVLIDMIDSYATIYEDQVFEASGDWPDHESAQDIARHFVLGKQPPAVWDAVHDRETEWSDEVAILGS